MLIQSVVVGGKRLSALGWLVLLLNLIDCQDVIKLVTNGRHHTASRVQSTTIHDELRHRRAPNPASRVYSTTVKRTQTSERAEGSANANLTTTGANSDLDLNRASAITATRADNNNGNSSSDKASDRIGPFNQQPAGANNDLTEISQTDSNSIGAELLDALKSFLNKLTSKVSLVGRLAQPQQQQQQQQASTTAADSTIAQNSSDAQAQKPSRRPSKSEIIQEILNSITTDFDIKPRKKNAGGSGATGGLEKSRVLKALEGNREASGQSDESARAGGEMMPQSAEGLPYQSHDHHRAHNQQRNAPDGRAGKLRHQAAVPLPHSDALTREAPEEETRGGGHTQSVSKSTSDIFKENLSIILEDHLEEWNSSSIDLDHLIKLHQQQTAASSHFQPIDQLKKVMSFMHFG